MLVQPGGALANAAPGPNEGDDVLIAAVEPRNATRMIWEAFADGDLDTGFDVLSIAADGHEGPRGTAGLRGKLRP